jgi:hypothetical protein
MTQLEIYYILDNSKNCPPSLLLYVLWHIFFELRYKERRVLWLSVKGNSPSNTYKTVQLFLNIVNDPACTGESRWRRRLFVTDCRRRWGD